MLKFPLYGFSKRVDDAVGRAMAILRAKEAAIVAKQISAAASPERRSGATRP